MGQEKNNTKKGKWKQLNERERYKIEDYLHLGLRPKEIAAKLGRDRRTIEREIARGSTVQRRLNPYVSRNPKVPDYLDETVYLADVGQRKHDEKSANKGRGLKIGHDHRLARYLEQKIGVERWSPDAAIGGIKGAGLQFTVSICTKTVYNMIERGDLLNLSNKDLSVKKEGKRRRYKRVRKIALNNTKGRSIEERPSEIEKRKEYGHWEMDCVVGSTKACLLVLTERASRKELIFKLKAKTQENVVNIIDKLEREHKGKFKEVFKSITMDNGCEFLNFEQIEGSKLRNSGTRTITYYAHSYSAWERGSNENQNKLIRRFVPKGADISKLTNKDVKRIEQWMNNYPRRMFKYKTSNDVYSGSV